MTAPSDGAFPQLRTDVPTSARMYDYCLGGKDNFDVDRAAVLAAMQKFPTGVDEARNNRLFLYRVVRFLARDAGIRQFLDLGSGLPTQNNVHEVAQRFRPQARVVYVDNDPIVLAHGRALLARDDSTTVITADITRPEEILSHPDTQKLIDLSQPMAVLFLSVGHSIVDDAALHHMVDTVREAVAPGSYLAFTQMVAADPETAEIGNRMARDHGYPWKNRLREEVLALLAGLEPVEPGFVNVADWRPDPAQPPLADVDEPLRPFLGAGATLRPEGGRMDGEFGGVVRKP